MRSSEDRTIWQRIAQLTPIQLLMVVVPLMLVVLIASSSSYYDNYHADGLVLVLMSIDKWTPFYWEQDRLGAFVPLLTSLLRNPFHNLVGQSVIYIMAGVGSFYLLPLLVTRDRFRVLVSGSLALALVASLLHPFQFYEYLSVQPVALPLVLYVLALLTVVDGRSALWLKGVMVLGFALLAMWINLFFATVFPLTYLLLLLLERRRVQLMAFLLTTVAAGLSYRWASLVPHGKTSQQLVDLKLILPGIEKVVLGGRVGVALLLTLGALVFALVVSRRFSQPRVRYGWVALMAVLSSNSLVLFSRHVHVNHLSFRYFLPVFVGLSTLAISIFVCYFVSWFQGRRAGSWLAPMGACLAVGAALFAASAAFPGRSIGIRATLNKKHGAFSDVVLREKIPLIVGDYWKVWPTVFHLKWRMHEEDLRLPVFGVAHRANPTRRHWLPFLEPGQKMVLFHSEQHNAIEFIQVYSQRKWRYRKVRDIPGAMLGTLESPKP